MTCYLIFQAAAVLLILCSVWLELRQARTYFRALAQLVIGAALYGRATDEANLDTLEKRAEAAYCWSRAPVVLSCVSLVFQVLAAVWAVFFVQPC